MSRLLRECTAAPSRLITVACVCATRTLKGPGRSWLDLASLQAHARFRCYHRSLASLDNDIPP